MKKSHVAVLSVVVLVASASAAVNVRDSMNMFGDVDMQGNKVLNATEYRFTSSFVREYDKNNNGKIGIVELGDAGQDFSGGELSIQKLQVLGEYFTTGKQISRGVKAAALSEDGKIIASGAYTGTKNGPTQAGNFTFSSDINLQNNNIYNAANLNGGTGGSGGGGSASNAAPALDWSSAQPVQAASPIDPSEPAEIDCGSGEVLRDVTCSVTENAGATADPEEPTSCDTRTEQSASLASGTQEQSHVYGTCVPLE